MLKTIGQLTLERDFLQDCFRQCGLPVSGLSTENKPLSLRRQCELLGISRSTPYYERKGSDAESVRLKEEILSRVDSGQGSQFTRMEYKTLLRSLSIRQSMDGKSRWADNIMIERWFRSLKTERVYINEFRSPKELRQVIR